MVRNIKKKRVETSAKQAAKALQRKTSAKEISDLGWRSAMRIEEETWAIK